MSYNYSHPRSFGFSKWKKTEKSKQDEIDVDEKRKQLYNNPNYIAFSKINYETLEPEDLKSIIKSLPLGAYISYIAYVRTDDEIKYRQGGFLVNNKDDRYFALSNRQMVDGKAVGISFSVQYDNLYDIFIKKDKNLKLEKQPPQTSQSSSPVSSPASSRTTSPIQQKIKEKKPRIRQKKYHIYLDGELYKSFPDNNKRLAHYSTHKFKQFSENKVVELVYDE